MSIGIRIAWLKIASAMFLILPGLMMIVGPVTPLMVLVNAFIDFAYLPFDGAQSISDEAGRLFNAILGGVLVGFGWMLWRASDLVFRTDQPVARSLILQPLLAWFACDSFGSVLAGAPFNAVLNAVILAGLGLPVVWPHAVRQSSQA